MTAKSAKFVALFLTFLISEIVGQTIAFNKSIGGFFSGGQMTFGLYKSYSSLYFDFRRYDRSYIIQSGQEKLIYDKLLSELSLPKFLLMQGTFYPLTAISSYLETDKRKIYDRFSLFDINFLRMVSGEYEEPFALSLFVGNILFMKYQFIEDGKILYRKQAGSALAGFAFSFGNYQILDNIYVSDPWKQFEFVLVGNIREKLRRRLFWNFRIGVKFHKYPALNNVLTLLFERNQTLYSNDRFSFLKNSILKYKGYFPIDGKNNPPHAVYHYLGYGKKFPLKIFKRTIFLVAAAGVRWEWTPKFDRNKNKFSDRPKGYLSWLILPNIEF